MLYQRLKNIISNSYPSAEKFAKKLEINGNTLRGYLSESGQKRIKFSFLLKILKFHPEIRREWLLFGEPPSKKGKTDIAEATDRRIVGDLLSDLIEREIPGTIEEKAKKLGITVDELNTCFGLKPPPSWDMLKKFASKLNINVNFLLTGKGVTFWPLTEIERVKIAVGANDFAEMAFILGIREKEIMAHLKLARSEGRIMPSEWHEKLLNDYSLNPGWTMALEYPSHIKKKITLVSKEHKDTHNGESDEMTAEERMKYLEREKWYQQRIDKLEAKLEGLESKKVETQDETL